METLVSPKPDMKPYFDPSLFLHEQTDSMESPRIMCPTFTTMLIRTIKALCEVNIKFEHKLEISGSLHIRSDGEKVVTCLLEEETIRPLSNRRPSFMGGMGAGEVLKREKVTEDPGTPVPPPTSTLPQRLPAVSTLLSGGPRMPLPPNPMGLPNRDMTIPEVSRALAMAASMPLAPGLALLANNALPPESLPIRKDQHRPIEQPAISVPMNMEPHSNLLQHQAHHKPLLAVSETGRHTKSHNSNHQHHQSSTQHVVPSVAMVLEKHTAPPPLQEPPHITVPQHEVHALNLSHSEPPHEGTAAQTAPIAGKKRDSLKSPLPPRSSPTPTSMASGSRPNVKVEPMEQALSNAQFHGLPGIPMDMLVGASPPVEVAGSSRKKFECMFCGCFLSTKCYLKNHINAMHTKARVYPCELCEKYFYSAGALRIHKLRNHWQGSKKHKCPQCEDQFLLPVELRRHISKKHGLDESALSAEALMSLQAGEGHSVLSPQPGSAEGAPIIAVSPEEAHEAGQAYEALGHHPHHEEHITGQHGEALVVTRQLTPEEVARQHLTPPNPQAELHEIVPHPHHAGSVHTPPMIHHSLHDAVVTVSAHVAPSAATHTMVIHSPQPGEVVTMRLPPTLAERAMRAEAEQAAAAIAHVYPEAHQSEPMHTEPEEEPPDVQETVEIPEQ